VKKKFIATIVIVVLLIAYFGLAIFKQSSNPKQEVIVPAGSSVSQISNILQDKGIIPNTFVFKVGLYLSGKARNLKPGKYILKKEMGYKETVNALAAGPKISIFSITIPEGYENSKIVSLLCKENPKFSSKKVTALISNSQNFNAFPFLSNKETKSLEGFLFPDTYQFSEENKIEDVINLMLKQFSKKTAGINWANNPMKYNTAQIVIIASMIEAEARAPLERPLISSVIYNRLKKGMRLEVDATVQYCLPKRKPKLFESDLKVASPYNTYQKKGLPAGPIGNPGLSSIKAALKPAKTSYLYYVLTDSKKGTHTFTNTYEEFLKARK